MTQQMIVISTNHPNLRFSNKDIIKTLKLVYRREGKKLPAIAVVLTYNNYIKKINREFLKHDYATDVISFSLGNDVGVEAEIYVNLDAAKRQAYKYKILYTEEVQRLLIHAVLHLIGYCDRKINEKRQMSIREDMYIGLIKTKSR
jgi:rRNA maturation RNase YbeY